MSVLLTQRCFQVPRSRYQRLYWGGSDAKNHPYTRIPQKRKRAWKLDQGSCSYCTNLWCHISATRPGHQCENLSLFPLTLGRLRRECEVMSTLTLWLETVVQFWRDSPVCLCSSILVQAAECAQVKFPLEETKMKSPLQKCSDAPWTQWVLSQGVGLSLRKWHLS